MLTLDPSLVQTPSPLTPLTVPTPQLVINHTANTPHQDLPLIVAVPAMELMEVVALTPPPTDHLLVVCHHLPMELPQEVLVTTTTQDHQAIAVTVSKN